MKFENDGFVLLANMALSGILIVFAAACAPASTPASTPVTATLPPAASPVALSQSSTVEPIPAGLVRNPVPSSAEETAAALLVADHPVRDHYRLAQQLQGVSPDALTPAARAPDLKVNDRAEFTINADLIANFTPVPARLRHLSDHAAWWAAVSAQVADDEIAAAAERFEQEILPTNRLIFGKEWLPGIDDDPRIHVLLVEEPKWGGVFGYFSILNEYPTAVHPASNEREMFVLNLGGAALDSAAFGGELAHEYQHLIHWSQDPNEDLWLNEALGELATFLSGAPEPTSAMGPTNAELFAENPDIQLTSWPETTYGSDDPSVFAHYAAGRLFTVYLLEQFGPQFIRNLVENPADGVVAIQQELDKTPGAPRFDDVYATWLLANLLNQPDLREGQFGYKEIRPLLPRREVISSFRGVPVADQLPPYGARYYEIRADRPVTVSFTGSTLARLAPTDPPGGRYVWYSNRGDESQFSLTRSFDLTGVRSATLRYKVWHELDQYWDYGYVEVSTDGREAPEHWTILKTEHGSEDDPYDQAFGPGYTGFSNKWLSESVDLSQYAGQVIQLRFEVLTDYTVNRDGLLLDDIEIPELGYFDGAEDDGGGWDAQGFVRSSNLVPARWIIWLLKLGTPTRIEWIEVQPDRTAEFVIQGFGEEPVLSEGEGFPFAALVVTPVAPISTLDLDYELLFRSP